MINEDNFYEEVPGYSPGKKVDGGKQELRILVTEEDKYGSNVAKMSNFFEAYIPQLTCKLSTNAVIYIIENIPIADLSIINEVVNHVDEMIEGKYEYVADFNSLPHDIKAKLDKGEYTIGESKQVDGNMRAVILDENDVRVKDITIKLEKNDSGITDTIRNIACYG